MVKGPFSSVDLSNLTDTPILARETVFQASAGQLLDLGGGMKLEDRAGSNVVVAQEGFFIEFEMDLPANIYSFAVEASAPDGGSDSYWILLDGNRLGRPLIPPVGVMGERAMTLSVKESGKHSFRMILRESPGSIISRIELYRAEISTTIPPMREELKDKHPRIFFTAADLDAMRGRLENPRVQSFYKPVGILRRKPPAFKPNQRNGGNYRSLGSHALSYLLEPDDEKLNPILEWLEMATTYPHCGVDLDAEYFIEGVALTYDWLYEHIPEDLRSRVRDTIARQCRQVYEASLNGRTGGGLSFQQNHYWYAHLSMALGAAAIYGEVPDAENWLAWSWDRFERIALSFSPDGGFHEGPSYWDFSMPTMYMYTDLYEWCTGLRIPGADEGLKGQAEFRFRHLYPGLNLSAALEDSGIHIGRPPIRLLLWEAKRFKDPLAMGMAESLRRGPEWSCWNLLWLDEELESKNPFEDLPLSKYYPDIETVFARTAWDNEATSITFVSRPLGGHKWAELCSRFGLGGTGHNHPAQNHFVLFGRGEVLAADPGYTYEKKTRNHNTILIDGEGQYGDGEMWPGPKPGRAYVTDFVTEGDITIITGDATSAYPEELGLTHFQRTLVLAGPDLVVVYDRLAAGMPKTYSWLLHHYGELSYNEGVWTITRSDAQLCVTAILPEQFTAEASTYRPQYIHPTRDLTPKEADVNLLELKAGPVAQASFLVILMVGNAGDKVPEVQNLSTSRCDAVQVGNIVVAFNRGEGTMAVLTPWEENFRTDAKALVARVIDGQRQVVTSTEK